MPKLKTHIVENNRFKVNKKGKINRAHATKRHLLGKKSAKQKRNLRGTTVVDATNVAQLKRLLPYK